MSLHILSVHRRLPDWVRTGVDDYLRRLNAMTPVVAKRIPSSRHADDAKGLDEEYRLIQKALPDGSYRVALDEGGAQWSVGELAERLERWAGGHKHVAFVIGGSRGLHSACLSDADARWSLSRLTFPHALVYLLLTEQLYRAYSFARGHPYHRE